MVPVWHPGRETSHSRANGEEGLPEAGILTADGALFIRRSITNDRSGAAPAGQRAMADAVRSAEDDGRQRRSHT